MRHKKKLSGRSTYTEQKIKTSLWTDAFGTSRRRRICTPPVLPFANNSSWFIVGWCHHKSRNSTAVAANSTSKRKISHPRFVSVQGTKEEKREEKKMQWMIFFFSPSGFLGNGEQVGGRRESLSTGGLVSHPDGSQVYFAPVLHLITGASVTGFSGGGRKRRRKWDTSHEPKKTTTLSSASVLLSQDTSCNTSQNHPCFLFYLKREQRDKAVKHTFWKLQTTHVLMITISCALAS